MPQVQPLAKVRTRIWSLDDAQQLDDGEDEGEGCGSHVRVETRIERREGS